MFIILKIIAQIPKLVGYQNPVSLVKGKTPNQKHVFHNATFSITDTL